MFGILLQATSAASNPYSNLILLGVLLIVFYFFMIRPQQKKAKDAKSFLEEVKVGDTVITIGGIHGTIIEKGDLTSVIEIARGMRVTIEKSAISVESTKRLKNPVEAKAK